MTSWRPFGYSPLGALVMVPFFFLFALPVVYVTLLAECGPREAWRVLFDR